MSVCRSCDAPIIWCCVLDEKGRIKIRRDGKSQKMPVDLEPNATGRVVVYDRGGTFVARVLKQNEQLCLGEILRTAHHITCPHADDWKAVRRNRP